MTKSDFIYCFQFYRPRLHKLDLPLSEPETNALAWFPCDGVAPVRATP